MDSEKADLITTLHALTSGPEASEEALSLNHWQAEDWSRMLAESKPTVLHPGEMLFKRGDDNSDLFFLVAGSLEVSVPRSATGSLTPPVIVTPGSVVGELAFFDRAGRSASVWSRDRAVLLSLSRFAFRRLVDTAPSQACDLLLALARIIAARLRRAHGD